MRMALVRIRAVRPLPLRNGSIRTPLHIGPGGQFDDSLKTIPADVFTARIELVKLFLDRLKPIDESMDPANDKRCFGPFARPDIDRLLLESRLIPEAADELRLRYVQSFHRLPVPPLDGGNAESVALPGPPTDVSSIFCTLIWS